MEKKLISNPFGNPHTTAPISSSRPNPMYTGTSTQPTPTTTSTRTMIPSTTNDPNKELKARELEIMKELNCSKGFLRTTSDKFPANSTVLRESAFPFGLVINPLSFYEPEIPVVSFGEKEIPRCGSHSCRAYINPFVSFIEGGEKWICNICKTRNTTDDYYMSPLDKFGNRLDRNERPELSFGSYEFLANKTYMKKGKDPNPPSYVFVIDVSLSAIHSGYTNAVCESIKDAITNDLFFNPELTKIGIITYDTAIHFYSINKKGGSNPVLLSVSDENVFIPSPTDSLLVNLSEYKSQLINILDLIENSFNNTHIKDSNKIYVAIQSASALTRDYGGKILLFNGSHTMSSHPKIKSNKLASLPKEEAIYMPTDDRALSNLGIEMTNLNISCDLFIAADTYINLVTLNQICDYTNGNLYFYRNFRIESHYKNLFNTIRRVISRPIGWEAVLRTRLSKGYKINSFITPILISNGDLLVMSTVDGDQSYAMTLDVIDDVKTTGGASDMSSMSYSSDDGFLYLQTALLYTASDNLRRIRVHNLCIPLTTKISEIYESVDVDCLSALLLKQTIDKIFKTKKLSNSVLSTENTYKSIIGAALNSQQSLKKELPESLAYLPLYMLGILKHRICCRDEIGLKYDIDLVNYFRMKAQKLPVSEVVSFIYPRIYSLHDVLNNESIGEYDSDGSVYLPDVNSASLASLAEDGLYLIDNGYILIIYSRMGTNPLLINSLFGTNDLSNIEGPLTEENVFTEPLDSFKQKFMNIIDYIRTTKSLFQNLLFVFEGTDAERIIKESLIEDNFCPWLGCNYGTYFNNTVVSSNTTLRGIR